MSAARPSARARTRRAATFALAALGAAALAASAPAILRSWPQTIRPHAPDWALFLALPAPVQLHVLGALAALAIGCVIWVLPKGKGPHKALGWAWIAAMTLTAGSSFFIVGLNGDFFSVIHLLSGWTLIALPMAVFAIRRRNVAAHRRLMGGLFVGGLLIAGALSFVPGRFMFAFVFG